MLVKKPLHLNDEDLVDGMDRIELPLSHPTTMSYSLQRIRLSEISRRMIDRTPLMMTHAGSPSHNVIMDFDTELQLLLNDVPLFFSMSRAEISATYQLDAARASNIVHQGYMHYSIVYGHRCKLHFPYFSLGFVDSKYAPSRDICLQSAHDIIQTELRLGESGLLLATRYTLLRLLGTVFMASIVILIDLCCNKSSSQQEKRRGEIAGAIRILEEAKHESATAAKFLDSLMHILRKHNSMPVRRAGQQMRHLSTSSEIEQHSRESHEPAGCNSTTIQPWGALHAMTTSSRNLDSSNPDNIPDMADDRISTDENLASYFIELAQGFEQEVDLDNVDWNNLLTVFDTSLI